jgi:hypothetical protein
LICKKRAINTGHSSYSNAKFACRLKATRQIYPKTQHKSVREPYRQTHYAHTYLVFR